MESNSNLEIEIDSTSNSTSVSTIASTATDTSSFPSSAILFSDSETDSLPVSTTQGNIFSKCPFCNGPYYQPWSHCAKGCKECNYALPPKGDSRTIRKCFFRVDHIIKSHRKSCDHNLEILKAHNEQDKNQAITYLLHCDVCDFLTSI